MKFLAENRRARFDYEILERFEAGIELKGYEVKSVKNGYMNLSGSYAIIRDGTCWLLNTDIPAHQPKNAPQDYDSKKTRRLLLRKKELSVLTGKLHEKGLSLIALEAHEKHKLVKLTLGLSRSRNKADKREHLKKRSALREMRDAN